MAKIIGEGYSYNDVLIVPKYNKISSRTKVDFRTYVTKNYKINIPILAANMDTICESKMAISLGKLGGLGVIHRFMDFKKEAEEVKKVKRENLIAAAAIGVKNIEERAKALYEAGVDIFVLDIAHGHSEYAGKTLDYLKKNFPSVDVMVGNIATKNAAKYFLRKGADALKIGIGPGSMCTTRINTGVGIPQLTAIMDVYSVTKGKIPICADGGIKYPGDIVKAIGAGADTVMSGFLFAGTEETPGKIIKKNGKKYKVYRGSASFSVSLKQIKINGENNKKIISIEGVETIVPYKGPIAPLIKKYLGGLSSGMTYIGASKMKEIVGKADFIKISPAGFEESKAHGLSEKNY
ncbi:MAG: guanosine monophosphate reductase [Candidatus Pacearchaeota archaeon]